MTKFDVGSEKYAMVTHYGCNTFGHVQAVIYNAIESNYGSLRANIKVTCQAGGIGGQEVTYAYDFGVSHDHAMLKTEDLQHALRLMKKIDKKVAQVEESFGRAQTFFEFCSRIIAASGVNTVFVNPAFGGGYRELAQLPATGMGVRGAQSEIRSRIASLEREVISRYARKAG